MSGIPFRGVAAGQDNRFTDKEKKLMKTMKFPKEYSLKVDVTKVNWEIMKEWSAQRVTQLLGMEDEVLIGYIHEQLGTDKKDLDPRQLQISLTGFLEKNTSLFVKELWTLLNSACEQNSGIPKKILDDKAEELRIKNEAQKAIQERLAEERAKKDAQAKEAAVARGKTADKGKPDEKDRRAQTGEAARDNRERGRDGRERSDRDRAEQNYRDRDRDRMPGRSDRGPERHDDRPRDYDRRRGASPVPPVRSMREDRDRWYDRDRGYQRDREADRYDRARDRGGPGRERSPVLKKARYGRSRSPGRRSSRSPARHGVARPRSSRSPEGKREVKGLHATFAKAEAETVQPEKADHLILPAQRVDTAFPSQPSDRGNGNAEADEDMVEANTSKDNKLKKEKKDKKDKKEKKEKKKHKKDKKDKRAADKDGGSSDVEALDKKQIEDELRQKALLSARKSGSCDE